MPETTYEFFIDSIELEPKGKNAFIAQIIPDNSSAFFPPVHLRSILVPQHFLEPSFFKAYIRNITESNLKLYDNEEGPTTEALPPEGFTSSIRQGGYYRIQMRDYHLLKDLFRHGAVAYDSDFFAGALLGESPYTKEINELYEKINIISPEDAPRELDVMPSEDEHRMLLYCFHVGQGDSHLLITSSNNAYLIDTNIYKTDVLNRFAATIREILDSHDIKKLKGLVFTHKHLDHIRGADQFIQEFRDIDNIFVNRKYVHDIKPFRNLIRSIDCHRTQIVDVTDPFTYREGRTTIRFINPYDATNCRENAPNINDSSICMSVSYGENQFQLTGDIGYSSYHEVLDRNPGIISHRGMLKVSHHGSDTGTNAQTIDRLHPACAFISAGNHKGHKHPHKPTVDLLKQPAHRIDLKISKVEKRTVVYQSDGHNITIL